VLIPHVPGSLAQLTKTIFESDGNIVVLGQFLGESSENREVTMKVRNIDQSALEELVKPNVERIIDIRST